MRDPNNQKIPYRFGEMEQSAKLVGIKNIAMIESNTRGILFEDLMKVISKSIKHGSAVPDENLTSDIERLFYSSFDQ